MSKQLVRQETYTGYTIETWNQNECALMYTTVRNGDEYYGPSFEGVNQVDCAKAFVLGMEHVKRHGGAA